MRAVDLHANRRLIIIIYIMDYVWTGLGIVGATLYVTASLLSRIAYDRSDAPEIFIFISIFL